MWFPWIFCGLSGSIGFKYQFNGTGVMFWCWFFCGHYWVHSSCLRKYGSVALSLAQLPSHGCGRQDIDEKIFHCLPSGIAEVLKLNPFPLFKLICQKTWIWSPVLWLSSVGCSVWVLNDQLHRIRTRCRVSKRSANRRVGKSLTRVVDLVKQKVTRQSVN